MTKIDTDALARLRDLIGGEEEDLAELIQDFSETAPSLVDEMVVSAGDGDWIKLKINAHSLKSNCKDFGAVALGDLCEALERESAQGEVMNAQNKVEKISIELKTVLQAMQTLDLKAF